jgi:translation initiation factor 1
MIDDRSRLVYSTEQDVQKTKKDKNIIAHAGPVSADKLLVRLDRKGRDGKSVTLIEGLPMPAKDKERLLKQLKTRLGAGGAMKDNSLELQGEHCEAVMAILQGMGLKPKRAGG